MTMTAAFARQVWALLLLVLAAFTLRPVDAEKGIYVKTFSRYSSSSWGSSYTHITKATYESSGAGYIVGTVEGSGREMKIGNLTLSMPYPEQTNFNWWWSWYSDAFVVRLDENGEPVFGFILGGTDYDTATDVAVDEDGNGYVLGSFRSAIYFNATTFIESPVENMEDIFVVKITSSGEIGWVKAIGGDSYDRAGSITVDSASRLLYISGMYQSVDMDLGLGIKLDNQDKTGTSADILVACLSADTGDVHWAKSFGGGSYDQGNGLFVDKRDKALYLVGQFYSSNMTVGNSTMSNRFIWYGDMFAVKLNATTGAVSWAKQYGRGYMYTSAYESYSKSIYFTGYFQSSQLGVTSNSTANLARIDRYGRLVWANSYHNVRTIAANSRGILYIGGDFWGHMQIGNFSLDSGYRSGIFIAEMSRAGDILNATHIGGTGYVYNQGMALDPWGSLYMYGTIYGGNIHINGITAGPEGGYYWNGWWYSYAWNYDNYIARAMVVRKSLGLESHARSWWLVTDGPPPNLDQPAVRLPRHRRGPARLRGGPALRGDHREPDGK